MRHYLRTDLYFLVNPVQLSLTVIFKILVLEYKLISEEDFLKFLTSLNVRFEFFRKEVLRLINLEQFSFEFFSNKKVEIVTKKFMIIKRNYIIFILRFLMFNFFVLYNIKTRGQKLEAILY